MIQLRDYETIVGADVINELEQYAAFLRGRVVQNINSSNVGGGVAEILLRMVPLLQEMGVDAIWNVIKGGEKFFHVTKKIHNALHGAPVTFSNEEIDLFMETNADNASSIEMKGDLMFIHDPQPIGLVERKKESGRKWIWRCHIDFSQPDPFIWDFLRNYIEQYDASVFSAPSYARDLDIPQILVAPSIDPFSEKNCDLPEEIVARVLEQFQIDPARPIVTQISRFDYLKDPVGVIKAYRMVKKHIDCQLVLAGGGATDDPEGAQVVEEVREAAGNDPDIFLLLLPPASDTEINALQRASSVVLQKSLREGFGLTVTEALWKAKPVVAAAVGGIPLQIAHKYSGLLTHSIEGTAFAIRQLLQEPEYAGRLGQNGKEHVRKNFLITRHLRDYLLLFLSLERKQEQVVYLTDMPN